MPEIVKPHTVDPSPKAMPTRSLGANTDMAAEPATAAMHQGAHAVDHAAQAAADSFRRDTQAVADNQRRLVNEAGEVISSATRHVADATQGAADSQRQLANETGQAINTATRDMAKAAQDATQVGLRRLAAFPGMAEGGVREMQEAFAGLAVGVMQANVHAMQGVMRLSNPLAVIELQQQFIHEYMGALIQGSTNLVHAIRHTAGAAQTTAGRVPDPSHRAAA